MIKYIKYLLVFLLATGFVACSEDEGAQILGGLYEKVDITPEPGMNLVAVSPTVPARSRAWS